MAGSTSRPGFSTTRCAPAARTAATVARTRCTSAGSAGVQSSMTSVTPYHSRQAATSVSTSVISRRPQVRST